MRKLTSRSELVTCLTEGLSSRVTTPIEEKQTFATAVADWTYSGSGQIVEVLSDEHKVIFVCTEQTQPDFHQRLKTIAAPFGLGNRISMDSRGCVVIDRS